LTAQPLNARVHLSWPAVPDATGYLLSRASSSNGAPEATFPLAALTYLDTGLNNGTEYWYAVAATNSIGPGANTEWVLAVPQAPTPPSFLPGSGVKLEPGSGVATIKFGASNGWEYQIKYTDDLLSGVWTAIDPPGWQTATSNGTMTVTDPTATNSPQRFYRIEIR